MIRLSPLTKKKITRFKSIRRSYWSAIILLFLLFSSCFAELLINNRALIVKYQGEYYFPTYGDMIPGKTFGMDYEYETNYRKLKLTFKEKNSGNWVLMPPVPYNAYENDFIEGEYPPYEPSLASGHFLGTDTAGRDIVARLFYGFRIAIWFSMILLVINYAVGVSIGALMGFWGGWFDLISQRIIEIWSNIPFLYIVMILSSIVVPKFWMLIVLMAIFGWMGMTWYLRTSTYKEKAREYVMASRALGASPLRIIFKHILPNSISVIITFIPFSIAAGITSLTSLDYLGFGLPPPTPSWGELLSQGTENMESQWILISVVTAMVTILALVTFIGEGIREAFDPKRHTVYR
ncbi:MAG: ABC transporter permease [Gammaproteobacteria bacterium]|nr:MAG: ABC transporter permease [Gammaproteobacteria bacterium]